MVYLELEWLLTLTRSEVDPTGSLWYTKTMREDFLNPVLKLTPQGHYGIYLLGASETATGF